jgi:hypothetical protein
MIEEIQQCKGANNMKKIALFKPNGKAIKLFDTLAEAQKWCLEHHVCNVGWVKRSLETGEKFYYPSMRKSRSYNGYRGAGYYVKWVVIKQKKELILKQS